VHLKTYRAHIDHLISEWRALMASNGFDAVVVHAGANETYFGDDQEPPFHAYGHFLRWVPQSDCEHAILVVPMATTPVLFWYAPSDYWYLASDAPEFCEDVFDVRTYPDLDELEKALGELTRTFSNVASFGRSITSSDADAENARIEKLQRQLDFRRAFKTRFERKCMEAATACGVLGHRAASQAFSNGESEYHIHLAYLRASSQHEADLPYPSIVATNRHAATLHYQKYDREPAGKVHSLLIDAGGKAFCYHSDITRTYAATENDEFAELIDYVDDAQQEIIEEISVGKSFLDLHESMCHKVANILCQGRFLTCSPTTAFAERMVDAFFPHGLGHLLGLQTHDVGGRLLDDGVVESPPHDRYKSLRLLRPIEPNMVFTIEPGIYFIPSLLKRWQGHHDFNWEKIDRFLDFGGVRIEDNVFVTENGAINLTREAFNAANADDA